MDKELRELEQIAVKTWRQHQEAIERVFKIKDAFGSGQCVTVLASRDKERIRRFIWYVQEKTKGLNGYIKAHKPQSPPRPR